MRVTYFIQDMIDMVKEGDMKVFVGFANLDNKVL